MRLIMLFSAVLMVGLVWANQSSITTLDDVLAQQPDDIQVRYKARHPKETLSFFGIKPGMTVVEADPGNGWYSNILHAYLGDNGHLIGMDYALNMYPLFNYYDDAELAQKSSWADNWPTQIKEGNKGNGEVSAYNFGKVPNELSGTVDAVLFIRVVHNLTDFEQEGQFLTKALDDTKRLLKKGGVVGVVQHMGPESNSDVWASGENGYLKKNQVIANFEAAGFVFDGESPINLNQKDNPTENEYVWRLPPTSEKMDDAELEAKYNAIGESNRMTLRFIKP